MTVYRLRPLLTPFYVILFYECVGFSLILIRNLSIIKNLGSFHSNLSTK